MHQNMKGVQQQLNSFLPIVTRNRKLTLLDLTSLLFKEINLTDLYSTDQANQCIYPQNYKNKIYIIGGHNFKNPSFKTFILNIEN